ncbi:MAG TPA: hypothetical protein VES73_10105, partial [Lamprocystis sp. (in: g-proteobacteria)]|nr:hypothetical protein [Lamprocystis sp. (in: g-proteobacteria)]
MPDAVEFDRLAAEFYPVWFRYHPDLAARAGVPVAHPLLPTQDDDDVAALRAWIEELILGLDEIEFAALDTDRQLDFELMAGGARVEHQESLIRDWRCYDPLRLLMVSEVLDMTGDEPQVPGALGAALDETLARLLGQIPEHLRQAQAHLAEVAARLSPALVRTAAWEAQHSRDRLRDLARGAWLRRHGQDAEALAALAETAADALAGFAQRVTADLAPRARGGCGCGREHLRLRLQQLHFIDCDPLDADAPIAQALRRTESALGELTEPLEGRGEGATPTGVSPTGAPLTIGDLAEPPDSGCLPVGADPKQTTRLPRRLANGTSLAVGWHLYLPGRLAHAGGAGGDEHRRRLSVRRGLIRRAQLDLDLHTGRIDDAQALVRLRDEGLCGPS